MTRFRQFHPREPVDAMSPARARRDLREAVEGPSPEITQELNEAFEKHWNSIGLQTIREDGVWKLVKIDRSAP